MRLLLDTHIFMSVVDGSTREFPRFIQGALVSSEHRFSLSVASIWEIAIKYRIGKLPLPYPPHHIPVVAREFEIELIAITEDHALAEIDPTPMTKDPFDRLLLAQCKVEGMRLVTLDRALVGHPLALSL